MSKLNARRPSAVVAAASGRTVTLGVLDREHSGTIGTARPLVEALIRQHDEVSG